MSTFKPRVFTNVDPGAPVLSGQVGALVGVLDHALTIGRVFSYNGSVYTDQTIEARLDGGTAFPIFSDGDTNDEVYFGHSHKFEALVLDIAVAASSGSFAWEYWNGTSWASLTRTDGTNSFTQDGVVTWAAPADWATTSVNSVTMYWVRVRCTSAPSTNPTVYSVTSTGWLVAFSGTNKRAYRTCAQGGGNRFYLRVDDNLTGAPYYAKARGYETMSDIDTGTGLFPTDAQVSLGVYWQKSITQDATARTWVVVADDRTFYLFIKPPTSTYGGYYGNGFGDFYSYVPNDVYRTFILGEYSVSTTAFEYEGGFWLGTQEWSGGYTPWLGSYAARPYQGTGGSVNIKLHSDLGKQPASGVGGFYGAIPYPNPADAGAYLAEVTLFEQVSGGIAHVRGRFRGLWCPLHPTSWAADRDTLGGAGVLGGKTFLCIKDVAAGDRSVGFGGVAVVETSDTWDVN